MPPLTDKVARLKGAFHDYLSKAPKDRGPVYKRSVNGCQSAVYGGGDGDDQDAARGPTQPAREGCDFPVTRTSQ